MSLYSLARAEVTREKNGEIRRSQHDSSDFANFRRIAQSAPGAGSGHMVEEFDAGSLAVTSEPAGPPNPAPAPSNSLADLTKYIPTETATLYLAAASSAAALKTVGPWFTLVHLYWLFGLLLTPAILVLIWMGERKRAGLPRLSFQDWPWFKIVASSIAFFAWALAVPGLPFVGSPTGGVLAAFAALLISTLLSLIARAFGTTD